jgi:hypothetical protein
MKKIILIASISILFFLSCEDNLNPIGELKNKYVLSCVIRGDSTFQSATLTRSYLTGSVDPYADHEDPNITGAIIRVWNGKDKVSFMYDSTATRQAEDKYKSPYRIYYTKNFQPDPGSSVEIEAILPDGRRLTSAALVPDEIIFNSYGSDGSIPSKDKQNIKIIWASVNTKPAFITRTLIYFNKTVNGKKFINQYTVPLNYVQYNNEWIPVYPKPSGDFGLTISMETMNKAMELLSGNDPLKSNYEILGCVVEVLSLDAELSKYYYATSRGNDAYSVKLDETDYTNITGGSGIFGAYAKSYWVMMFKHTYIYSYGYMPGLADAP